MDSVTALSLGRIAVGAAAFADPVRASRLAGLDPTANPQLAFAIRLAGSRDVALGLLTLLSRGRTRRALILAGAAVDASDGATGYLALRDGTLAKVPAYATIAASAGAVATGAAAIARR